MRGEEGRGFATENCDDAEHHAGPTPGPLVVERREHVRLKPTGRKIPAPSRSALLAAAVLAVIAAGSIHLSTSGTAVPSEPPSDPQTAEVSLPPAGENAPAGNGAQGEAAGKNAGAAGAGDQVPGPGSTGIGPAGAGPAGAGATETGAPGTAAGEVVVYVSGVVKKPGIVRLPAGSRVDDALTAAGGATDGADLAAVNLARPLTDGEQIHVPKPGEAPPVGAGAAGGPGGASVPGGGGETGGLVNLNTADAAALQELPGVGPSLAERILEHREANGPFRSVDDLDDVPGIGPKSLEKMREKATVGQ